MAIIDAVRIHISNTEAKTSSPLQLPEAQSVTGAEGSRYANLTGGKLDVYTERTAGEEGQVQAFGVPVYRRVDSGEEVGIPFSMKAVDGGDASTQCYLGHFPEKVKVDGQDAVLVPEAGVSTGVIISQDGGAAVSWDQQPSHDVHVQVSAHLGLSRSENAVARQLGVEPLVYGTRAHFQAAVAKEWNASKNSAMQAATQDIPNGTDVTTLSPAAQDFLLAGLDQGRSWADASAEAVRFARVNQANSRLALKSAGLKALLGANFSGLFETPYLKDAPSTKQGLFKRVFGSFEAKRAESKDAASIIKQFNIKDPLGQQAVRGAVKSISMETPLAKIPSAEVRQALVAKLSTSGGKMVGFWRSAAVRQAQRKLVTQSLGLNGVDIKNGEDRVLVPGFPKV